MSVGRRVALCGVLLVLVAVPLSVRGLQPNAYGGWPALGFAVGLFVVGGRPWRWYVVAALTVITGPALSVSYDVSLPLGLLGSLSSTVPAYLTWWLLTSGGRVSLRLDLIDSRRYHVATALSAALCGVTASLTVALISPWDVVALSGLMSFLAALTAQLLILPLFIDAEDGRAAAGRAELWLQRVALLATVLLVFVPTTPIPDVFLLYPPLAWAAIRSTRRETHAQLFLACLAGYGFTFAGHGPLVDAPAGLPEDLSPALLYVFVAAACYLIVPLTLTVDQLFAMTAQANRAATTVERLIDSATHTVFIATDAVGRITHYNSGAARTLGYDEDDVLGRSPEMFHTHEEIARQAQHFGVPAEHPAVAVAQAASGTKRDWAFRHRDGTERMISLSLSEVTDTAGTVVGYIAAGEDISDRLRAQNALTTALTREHASVVRLQEVDHVKQELVSNVSHELRTPITSIAGYAELLADGALGELTRAQVDAVQRIERNTSRLGLLVEDLLTMSRAESGQLFLERTTLDLRDVAGEAFDMLGELMRVRDLEVTLDLPAEPVPVVGDQHALERVAVNLLSNAIKFTPDKGRVRLVVRRADDGSVLEVSDTGLGIPEEDQKHLFTRFFRSSAATEHAIQGTGLGLSIVHAIVSQHGGSVEVVSAPAQGTRITVHFPEDHPTH